MKNALTIDVEEFFQIHALSGIVQIRDWDNLPSKISENIKRILDILDKNAIKATFFFLGWIAERDKALLRRISDGGHEIASHGYIHQVIYSQNKDRFREDVRKSKAIIEDITGRPVMGYRAPTYSITAKTLWALDVLQELGFKYDSSIFPVHHDNYGIPDAPRFPYRIKGNELVEFPISTVKLGRINFPIAGGGYFRLFPYMLTKLGLKSIQREGQPFIFYVHPWEFNPDNPIYEELSFFSRFRTYVNISKTGHKFEKLTADFEFTTAYDVLRDLGLLRC